MVLEQTRYAEEHAVSLDFVIVFQVPTPFWVLLSHATYLLSLAAWKVRYLTYVR